MLSFSVGKLQRPYDFLCAVYDYEILGRSGGVQVARVIPWLEFIIGLSLLLGYFQRGALALGVILLATFTIAQVSVLSRDLKIPCGCSITRSGENISAADLARTGALCAGSLFCLVATCWWNFDRSEGAKP